MDERRGGRWRSIEIFRRHKELQDRADAEESKATALESSKSVRESDRTPQRADLQTAFSSLALARRSRPQALDRTTSTETAKEREFDFRANREFAEHHLFFELKAFIASVAAGATESTELFFSVYSAVRSASATSLGASSDTVRLTRRSAARPLAIAGAAVGPARRPRKRT